ncbi:SusD/RagB family nutrient-binding outer membrane lipoprotein [Pedobacter sp. MC2016-15]|uniref:SusD/RagB family nutrient-binding outer membrane lipoprotein n=1 Tax=Pedobacter sp. MC2016-15 TaxID=2994473 RepID=UPI0022476D56|nr:SusD/RagB family nutrient-binding outer membrane lipoprotein [Pedobacter sp. MC2016-15]MCX2480389.1 SusD/RagB family nutrient-binding outer membrane lipoprotein [Pedobacter sp. MC2016-15]
MKKIFIYLAFSAVVLTTSCSKERLGDTNTDPKAGTITDTDPNFLLTSGELGYANTGYTQLLYQSMAVQGLASTLGYYGNGDKYVNTSGTIGYQARQWNEGYTALSKLDQAIKVATAQDANKFKNVIQIAKINQIFLYQRISDTYGAIPFSEALMAQAGNVTPKYDSQQSVYVALLTNLETAINALDPNAAATAGDLYFKGDVAKWKKAGYSLMLRLAMRLTKVDAATAKTWVEKAYAGGLMASNSDNMIFLTDAGYDDTRNASAGALRVTDDFQQVRWSQTFINFLKATNDPRISAIAEIAPAGLANNRNLDLTGNNAAAIQVGMPNGYDLGEGATNIARAPGYPGASGTGADAAVLGNYSRPRSAIYIAQNAPVVTLSYAETEFLLAEAAFRGWAVGASAAVHYSNAVTASLTGLAQINTVATIDAATASAFAAAHPLLAGQELKMINEQYWANENATFSFIESWINWRRSGFPVLTPVNYPGNVTNGTIPRRMIYPQTERTANGTNYLAAVATLQGGDFLTSRVWWDVAN